MPNRHTHMAIGAVSCTIAMAGDDRPNEYTNNLAVAPILGAVAARLPDILEPAHNPHHRQFFHSFAMLIAVGAGVKQVYTWEPHSKLKEVLRGVLIIGGVAYMSHLIADGCTPKSLPLLGKL